MSGNEIEIVKDDDPYTRVLNALIFDENLRLQTRMVLIMMTSVRPDWDFSVRGMAKIAHVTKDTMAKMLAELEEAGYVRRKAQPRNAEGRFSKAGYLVSRKPIFKNETDAGHKNYDTDDPCPTSPYTIEPDTKNSPQLNTKQLTTKQLISPCSPPPGEVAPAGAEPEGKPAARDKPRRFIPPDVEQVRVYCRERRNSIDPESFVDYYASKGWTVGRAPMKDWKAAVRTWERRRRAERKEMGEDDCFQ